VAITEPITSPIIIMLLYVMLVSWDHDNRFCLVPFVYILQDVSDGVVSQRIITRRPGTVVDWLPPSLKVHS